MMARLSIPLFSLILVSAQAADENWTQFRGPTVRGHLDRAELPTAWSEASIKWKAALKGTGQSSPVNWGEKLYLTSASADGRERYVTCLSAADGSLVWEDIITCEKPEEIHAMNSHATPSCSTDGKFVVAFFGPAGLHAYDLAGKKQWSLVLGE
ncbi:MAG: PQQ-binding-like beta-propeller repeat protein, partial [Verrucomicrobiales bacterium]